MILLEILIGIPLLTLGLVAVICAIGFWSTVQPRLNHKVKMVQLAEEQKLNALTIEERDFNMQARRLELMSRATTASVSEPAMPYTTNLR